MSETFTEAIEEQEPTFQCPSCEAEHDDETEAEQCCWTPCPICDRRHEDSYDADHCCQTACPGCGELFEYESEAEECCQYRCSECGELHEYEEQAFECCHRRGGDPYYPQLAAVTPYTIEIEGRDDRAPRFISIEQELTAGGAAVARMLYDQGLSEASGVEDYSHAPGPRGIAVCEDGSLPSDGGEVKYSKFDLARRTDATKMSMAVTKIRQLHKDAGIVNVGSAAGMHIHNGAKDRLGRVLGPVPMAALHELFTFGEDMIYGLAAAGWTSGHRYSGGGNDYAKPIPRVDGKKSPWKISRVMGSKYYGINFERLLNTVGTCRCGSVRFGSWSECECGAFDHATVEWRVFNTSTMPETIHAWLLFTSAVMELAHTHTPDTLPDNPYRPSGAVLPARIAKRQEILAWFLAHCPLNNDERDVIRAAADRSPLLKEGA
jgi:hypothetical protein